MLIQLLLPSSGASSAVALAPLAQTRRELADRFTHVTANVDHLQRDCRRPLAMLGALGVTAGVTAYLVRPARLFASTRRRQALIAYLRDHLSGSDMALRVVHRLGSTHQGTEDGTLFRRLSKEFEEDRAVVRTLLTQLGASGRSIKRAAGNTSGPY